MGLPALTGLATLLLDVAGGNSVLEDDDAVAVAAGSSRGLANG